MFVSSRVFSEKRFALFGTRARAGGEPNESVRRLSVIVLRGLRRDTGIHFRCNPR
jgi:hypothetical protein